MDDDEIVWLARRGLVGMLRAPTGDGLVLRLAFICGDNQTNKAAGRLGGVARVEPIKAAADVAWSC